MDVNNHHDDVTLLELWAQTEIEDKYLYDLSTEGELFLKNESPKDVICKLTTETFQTTIDFLQQKFKEITDNHKDIIEEWHKTEDKISLQSKLEKAKEYLDRAKVIGNITPLREELNEMLSSITQLLNANLKIREALVIKAERIKDNESYKDTHQEYKDIVEAWKQAPHIEKHKLDQLWDRIDTARTYFYERKRQHQEEIENEYLANLDLKLELAERSEALANSTDWKKTTEVYKELTEQWKTIGKVVSQEKNEELWNRFIGAQNNFFEQKRKHYEQVNAEQEQNYLKKVALVEVIEAINLEDCNWKATTDKVMQITDEWKQIGRVPREHSDSIWQRFLEAKNIFFDAKRNFTEQVKLSQEDNLAKKQALIARIEKIKNSTQWHEVTQEMNELMDEWKQIGPVPRKVSDIIWEQFIGARRYFFNRKDADRDKRQQNFYAKLDNKIEQTKDFLTTLKEEMEDDKAKIEEFTQNLSGLNTADSKDKEIKNHLENLIVSLEKKLPQKAQKITNVEIQLQELLEKKVAAEAQKTPSDSKPNKDEEHLND